MVSIKPFIIHTQTKIKLKLNIPFSRYLVLDDDDDNDHDEMLTINNFCFLQKKKFLKIESIEVSEIMTTVLEFFFIC